VDESGMIIHMGKHKRSVMVAMYGARWEIPPINSNNDSTALR